MHRDLKPANIKIDPEDKVKILDFGLAKALSDPTASVAGDPTESPTITMGGTIAGTILGTAAYMAPEQARGKKVDRRADIWAFGVVVWEMLTGERLFKGEDTVQVLSRVLEQPPDLDRVPAKFRKLLSRCLDRNVKDRLRDIGEARFLLQESAVPEGGAGLSLPAGLQPGPPEPPHNRWFWPAAAAVLLLALAALAAVHFRETPPPEQTTRYSINLPENSNIHSFALSPDGRTLVIAAAVNGKRQLYLRPMDALQFQPMAFTEEATYPFWSPDTRFIGFFAQGKLKKVAAGLPWRSAMPRTAAGDPGTGTM